MQAGDNSRNKAAAETLKIDSMELTLTSADILAKSSSKLFRLYKIHSFLLRKR
jgi:hypothetical protein